MGRSAAVCRAPDESAEESRGVADDASSARLLMLTALQGQPVIHVTLCMQTCLWGWGEQEREREKDIAIRIWGSRN